MKTLVATDGSDYAATAMSSASRVLQTEDNQFDLMCVIPELRPVVRSKKLKAEDVRRLRGNYEAKLRLQAEHVLKEAARTLRSSGITARQIVEVGPPADVLARSAEDYDVVVVGAHHRADRPGPGIGPVASRVLDRADTMVLIGRELLNEKTFRVLVPVDGSAASENAVARLASGFELRDADVTLMQVIEQPWLRLNLKEDWRSESERPYAEAPEDGELEELFGRELQSEADQIVEAAREQLSGTGASTESLLVEGNPGAEILRQAEVGEYDLVVVGATGATDLKHTLLGSVSFKLAYNAPCSVAVVR